jgi:aralkylamine N-acetyltransferase
MNKIQFSIVETWEPEPIMQLYKDAGWWMDEYDPGEIPWLIQGSYRFIVGVAEKTHETMAMGRILSDGVCTGIIQDMCVLNKYRGHGIGQELLKYLIKAAIDAGIFKIFLVAETGTREFYEKSGFISNNNQIFLLNTR